MLVISGVAESVKADPAKNISKGNVHGFNLFSCNENLEEQLDSIEAYFNARGWDNIVIEEQELINDATDVKHDVMIEAINVAKSDGMAGVFHNEPVAAA